MKTKIFACFPETGKTYASRMHSDKVKELNSKFYYLTDDHEYLFHEKYIRDLEKLIGNVEIILIDTNLKILDELNKKGIEFSYILPELEMLDQIMIDHNEYEKQKLINHYIKICTPYTHPEVYFLNKGASVNIFLEKNNLV